MLKKFFVSLLAGVIAIVSLTGTCFADSTEDSWSNTNWVAAQSQVDIEWNEPGYGLIWTVASSNLSISISDLQGGKYGAHVNSKSDVTDNVDFIARTIFSEIINDKPRVDNAFALAQTIKNRARTGLSGSTPIAVCKSGAYEGINTQAFTWPSNHNYNPYSSEGITKEYLFTQCLYLAKCLNTGYEIPVKYANGSSAYPNVGNARYVYDTIKDIPFYLNANKVNQCQMTDPKASNYITKAKYYDTTYLNRACLTTARFHYMARNLSSQTRIFA